MSNKTKRLVDQVLILKSIQVVREELAIAHINQADIRTTTDIMDRLSNLYSCLDVTRLAEIAKEKDERSSYDGV